MTDTIQLHHVKKSYDGRLVLSIDELSIKPGTIYGLIGPNGAGKTTLMKALLGLVPYEGSIDIFGARATPTTQTTLNRHIGSLIEHPSFYGHLTGYENLAILCRLKGLDSKGIDPTLEKVGLSDAKNKKAKAYSLGMKQRLGIAMALIGEPELLILDEPINGLDPYGIDEMRHLFQSVASNGKTSLLISSHILDEIEKIATHIGILERGTLRYNGSLADYRKGHPAFITLKTSDNKKACDRLALDPSHLHGDKLVLGPTSNEIVAGIVKTLTPDIAIYRIEEEKESLESLFMKDFTHGKGGDDHGLYRS